MVFQPMTVIQISHNGALIETPFPLQLDSLHEFRLSLGERSVVVKGRIVHCYVGELRNDVTVYRSGIELVEPSEPVRAGDRGLCRHAERGAADSDHHRCRGSGREVTRLRLPGIGLAVVVGYVILVWALQGHPFALSLFGHASLVGAATLVAGRDSAPAAAMGGFAAAVLGCDRRGDDPVDCRPSWLGLRRDFPQRAVVARVAHALQSLCRHRASHGAPGAAASRPADRVCGADSHVDRGALAARDLPLFLLRPRPELPAGNTRGGAGAAPAFRPVQPPAVARRHGCGGLVRPRHRLAS